MCGQFLFLAQQTGLLCTGEALSAEAQGLVPTVSLEEEVYEGVVHCRALGKEARQKRDRRRYLLLLLGVEHGPEAHRHVRRPSNNETRTDHEGHLQRKGHVDDWVNQFIPVAGELDFYQGDFPLNVSTLEVLALDGLVRPVQLPGDAKVGAEDDGAGQKGAERGQSHDEGGVVERLFVADPVDGAGQSKGLRPVAPPAQQGQQSPQAGVQPDAGDHAANGPSVELNAFTQRKKENPS